MSALSLSLRDKERLRDWEIERAWQKNPLLLQNLGSAIKTIKVVFFSYLPKKRKGGK